MGDWKIRSAAYAGMLILERLACPNRRWFTVLAIATLIFKYFIMMSAVAEERAIEYRRIEPGGTHGE